MKLVCMCVCVDIPLVTSGMLFLGLLDDSLQTWEDFQPFPPNELAICQ